MDNDSLPTQSSSPSSISSSSESNPFSLATPRRGSTSAPGITPCLHESVVIVIVSACRGGKSRNSTRHTYAARLQCPTCLPGPRVPTYALTSHRDMQAESLDDLGMCAAGSRGRPVVSGVKTRSAEAERAGAPDPYGSSMQHPAHLNARDDMRRHTRAVLRLALPAPVLRMHGVRQVYEVAVRWPRGEDTTAWRPYLYSWC